MDFAVVPPEINSALIYTGPGSGPMLAAAAAWAALAADLISTASSYQAVIAELTAGPWLGPTSAAMATAAAPYMAWMRTTASQAEQAANQAKAAATAYETAFAETVPPPVVSANRALLVALVTTNIFGQNTPAIATTETQYAEIWAQDTSAMYGYAGSAASATTLAPFTSPPSSTNTDGQANQAAAVTQATGTAAGDVQSTVLSAQQALTAIPATLSGLASAAPAAALSPTDLLNLLSDLIAIFFDLPANVAGLGADTPLQLVSFYPDVASYYVGLHTDQLVSSWGGIEDWPGTAPVPVTPITAIPSPGSLVSAGSVSAGMADANTVGKLSVPAGWTGAAPALRAAGLALPATSTAAAAAASSGGAGSLWGQMATAGMAGRAMAGTGGAGAPRPRERIGAPTGTPGEPPLPSESPQVLAGGPITSIAAELRELASLRDSGILTEEEFTEQKRRLLAQ
jgi:PPE-repeat protein